MFRTTYVSSVALRDDVDSFRHRIGSNQSVAVVTRTPATPTEAASPMSSHKLRGANAEQRVEEHIKQLRTQLQLLRLSSHSGSNLPTLCGRTPALWIGNLRNECNNTRP